MMARRVAVVAVVLGGVVGVLSAWLTWTVSGSAERNSYASLRAAQRLGIEELTPFRVVWFLVPVVVLATVVLLAAGARRSAGALAVVTGLVLVGFGAGVLLTPVAAAVGPWSACVAGVVASLGGLTLLAQGFAAR